jgi:hypothetical protein
MIVQRRWPHCLCARDAAADAEWRKWNAAFLAFVQGKDGEPLAALLRSGRPVPQAAAYALAELIDPTLPWNQFNWRKPARDETQATMRRRAPRPGETRPRRIRELKATVGKTKYAREAAKATTSPAVRLVVKPLSEKHRIRLARNGWIVAKVRHEKTENGCSTHEAAMRVGNEVHLATRQVTDIWETALKAMPFMRFAETITI